MVQFPKPLAPLPLLFLLLSNSSISGTTGLLEGRIRDRTSKQIIVGATIQVLGTASGAAADTDGFYQIPNVRAGTYGVRYSAIGYRALVMQNVSILPDLRTRIDIELEVSAVELDAVEVYADRPLIRTDLPSTAYSIGEVKLDKLPVSSFQEVLGLQPGTTVEGNVRGGKANEVVYLVDGLPVQDVVVGGLGMNLPKSAITGFTIHTGGFEAQYGNAMSGVINVVTKTGTEHLEASARLERDSWLGTSTNEQQDRRSELEITAGGPILRDQLYFFTANDAGISDTRWWKDFDKFDFSPVSREFNGLAKLEYIVSPSVRLALQGIYSFRSWHDYEFSWRFNLSGLPPRNRDSYRVAFSVSQTLSREVFYVASVSRYYHRNGIGDNRPAVENLPPYEYDFFLRYIVAGNRSWWADTRQIIYSAKGEITAQLGRSHIIKSGVEFNYYDISSEVVKYEPQTTYFGKPIANAELLNYSNRYEYFPRSGSIYVQDKVELVRDGSSFSLGVRWDFLDPTAQRPLVEFVPVRPNEYEQRVTGTTMARFKHQISPRLAFSAPAGPASFFFVNFGHYFQFPLFEYLYSGSNPSQLRAGARNVLTGNPDLEPERTIALETGFKYSIGSTVLASATYFRKRIKSQIDTKTLIPFDSKSAGGYGFASYVNNAQADVTGLEFLISQEKEERFSASLSYTYMVTEGVSEYVNQTLNLAQWGFPIAPKSYPLSWDQRHTIKADVDFVTFGGVRFNAVALFNSPRPYTYYPTRDGYLPLDTARAFVPNNARMENVLFVNVKVTKEFESGFVSPESRVTVYADARNLFNAKNIRWMDSSGKIGGELGDPSAYYDPRRIRFGARVEF